MSTTATSSSKSSGERERSLRNRTYKMLEIVGVSENSVQDAVRNAVARAGETLTGLGWFEVTNIRGMVKNDEVVEFQVTVKIGFRLLSPEEVKTSKRSRRTAGPEEGSLAWDETLQ
jgi:flavin-binding protein dodecin